MRNIKLRKNMRKKWIISKLIKRVMNGFKTAKV